MQNELVLCAAAFFRNKGKGVITEKEFLMGISMDLRWMPYKDAQLLLRSLVTRGVLNKEGEYLRPGFDEGAVDVPVAYHPQEKFIQWVRSEGTKTVKRSGAPDLFALLIEEAEASGMKKKEFMSQCNGLQKKMDVDIAIAALMVLRDRGVDVAQYADGAFSRVTRM
jgi:hypothetical protein